jgi:hypothetical protein
LPGWLARNEVKGRVWQPMGHDRLAAGAWASPAIDADSMAAAAAEEVARNSRRVDDPMLMM